MPNTPDQQSLLTIHAKLGAGAELDPEEEKFLDAMALKRSRAAVRTKGLAGKPLSARETKLLSGQDLSDYVETQQELADQLGCDRRTITNTLRRNRKLVESSCGKNGRDANGYHVPSWRAIFQQLGIVGRGLNASNTPDERELRLRGLKIKLDREELELAKARDKLLPLSEYQEVLAALCSAILGGLNALPGRVNPLLEGLDFHDRQKKLEEEVEIIKQTVRAAKWLPAIDPSL